MCLFVNWFFLRLIQFNQQEVSNLKQKRKYNKTKERQPRSFTEQEKAELAKKIEEKRNYNGPGNLTFNQAKNSWSKTCEIKHYKNIDFPYPECQIEHRKEILNKLRSYLTKNEQKNIPLHELDDRIVQFCDEILDTIDDYRIEKDFLYMTLFDFLIHIDSLQNKRMQKLILLNTKSKVKSYLEK